jgi:hypothetical protein
MYILLTTFLTFPCTALSAFEHSDAYDKQSLLVRTNFTFIFNCKIFDPYELIRLFYFEADFFGKAY